ncbi:energy transducer TonB, partial [Corallococcus exiguus]|nr:energy transducer TonB [Corallococcus exiguus]
MRTILNFDDGLGASPTLPQAATARADAMRSPVGLFQSATAPAETGWGRWSGALVTATAAHVLAVVVGVMAANQPPAEVKKPEPELVLMAYAPPPPPLGGGAVKQATPEPVKSVVPKPRPKHRELVVPAKVPEPVKETPVEQVETPAATEVSAVASQAPAGPGVPDGAVGGVVGG